MQRDALEAMGCDLIFEDRGVSGAKATRPGLDALLAEAKPGDTVVVLRLDRLGRSVLHLADLLVRFQKDGVHFCSLSEGINTTTPGGKLTFHLFSAVAEFQRDIIVETTVEGIEAARRRGKRLGRPPRLSADDIAAAAHSAMHQQGRSKADIAQALGVSRMTVERGMKRLGLAL